MKSVFKKISIAVIICFSLILAACPGVNNPESEIIAGPITATSLKTFVPGKNSVEMAANMTIGWNLGNTFDATGKAGVACENAWGQPTTTKEMIHGIRQAGFVTIRIPVSWHDHIKKGSSTYEIEEAWINRVKQVVDWSMEEGLCVIINMHHDNLSENEMKKTAYGYDVTKDTAIQEKSQKYIAGVWKNVAEAFKDYDHSLVFELLNEPRDVGGSSWGNEWWVGDKNAEAANTIIGNYEQAALNEIRATGSKNADRFILVPAYAGSSDCIEGFSLPEDSAESRIMIETHGYTPYVFAMQANPEGGTHKFTESHKNDINWMLTNIYNNFVSKGIGVVMDEMGVTNKNNEADRIEWAKYYFSTAHSKGIPCLWWDNGNPGPDRNGTEEQAQKTSVYQMYWDYAEPLNQVKPHRILAINRAEREGALEVTLDVEVDNAVKLLQKKTKLNNKYHAEAIEDGVVRLLSPAVLREIRSDETDEADEHGIGIFSENLKNLLMTQPIKGSRVLGIDPGIRTGTKCAALDETGKYLGYFKFFQVTDPDDSYNQINNAIDKYDIQVVAVGNGTGSQEVQAIVAKVISENYKDVMYTVVDESGASVYSASDIAREEFPELDLTIRGAISMGRRLQDPLAELVKIDPKAIGVGLYQHDVNQKKLSDMLDEVVGSVVNQVGVNLNTASASLLKYVSGINSSLAKKIIAYRDANGKITSRDDLKKVSGLGPKAFEQCAGFLKIPESENPLDNTWVHPENYEVAKEVLPLVQKNEKVTAALKKELEEKYGVGETTINDIIDELAKPNRDPRDGYPAPIMQKGVVKFEDLTVGMKVTGKIRNVVDFGAFVDIGLHETGLIHISELSDSFVSDPMEVIKVGDVKEFTIISLDVDRRRISLSLKSDAASRIQHEGMGGSRSASSTGASGAAGAAGGKKKVVVIKKGAGTAASSAGAAGGSGGTAGGYSKTVRPSGGKPYSNDKTRRENYGSDDGYSYNPFAALLKDRK